MKTAEDFIHQMESSDILMTREHTFNEYVSDLMKFQEMVCKLVTGDAYHERMRIDEAQFIMEGKAREKHLRSHPAVQSGVTTMKKLDKEIRITMSGANGERMVSQMLSFLERPNTRVFRNIYVTDGQNETELDAVLLTDAGIIILEVKRVKTDLTLTTDGRMVFAGDECYDKMPLGEKMALKRKLLKKHLEKVLAEKGLEMPVEVDSLIVFSAPKDQYIRVNDRYRREKYCFSTTLNKRIQSYTGWANYNADQLDCLSKLLAALESDVKRFDTSLNYDEVRSSLAAAMAVLQDKPAIEQKPVEETSHIKESLATDSDAERMLHKEQQKAIIAKKFFYAAASVCAGVMVSTAAVLGMSLRRI